MTSPVAVALDKAVTIPSATVEAHVRSIRRRHPYAPPAEVIRLLEKEYLTLVSSTGAAVGAAAALPVVGTGTALALTSGDVAAFVAASAALALGVASVHGIAVDDVERRRALVVATILGEPGVKAVSEVGEIPAVQVGRVLLTRMPLTTVRRVNQTLTKRLVRNQAAKQGSVAVGRMLPYGIGAAVGGVGGRALGKTVVTGARAAFGPPPRSFPAIIEITADVVDVLLPPATGDARRGVADRPAFLRRLTTRRGPSPDTGPPFTG